MTTVIGTLLVLALVTALLVNYQLRWVPLQTEEREASHMALVSSQLGGVVGVMDQQLQGTGNTTLSSPIAVGIPGRNFPWVPAISHQVELQGISASNPYRGINISSSRFTTVQQDGTDLTSLGETWTGVATTDTLSSVTAVRALRLHLSALDVTDAGRSVSVAITDADSNPAGTFTLDVSAYSQNFTVGLTVVNGTGTTLYVDERGYFDGTSFADYYVDVLNPEFGFDQLLTAANGPYTLTFSQSAGFGAEHAVTYVQEVGTSQVLQNAGGLRTWSYAREMRTAQALYTASNTQFVDQTYYVDNGALLVRQSDGTAFKVEPRFTIEQAGTDLLLTLTVPQLRTTTRDYAGVTDVSLRTTVLTRSSIEGWGTDLTIHVVTQGPAAWATFFTERFEDAGIPDTYYTITQGSNFAAVTIEGAFASSAVDDVFLSLEHATINLEVN